MPRLLFSFRRTGAIRAAVVALLVAYVSLTGQAIHCRYFPTMAMDGDAGKQSSTDHGTHCTMAQPNASLGLNVQPSDAVPELAVTAFVVLASVESLADQLDRLTPSRAPPAL